jgi:hypothetical protein
VKTSLLRSVGSNERRQSPERAPNHEKIMRRLTVPVLALSLLIAACSVSTDTTDTEQAANAEFDADAKLIESTFQAYADAFLESFEAGTTYHAGHAYPTLACTVESTLAIFYELGGIEDTTFQYIVDRDSIERDDEWAMDVGSTAGDRIDGRTYSVTYDATQSVPGYDVETFPNKTSHMTVLDGEAYFFFVCWEGGLQDLEEFEASNPDS